MKDHTFARLSSKYFVVNVHNEGEIVHWSSYFFEISTPLVFACGIYAGKIHVVKNTHSPASSTSAPITTKMKEKLSLALLKKAENWNHRQFLRYSLFQQTLIKFLVGTQA